MAATETMNDLRESLTKFEKNLQTPIVSGELSAWMEDVRESFEQLCDSLKHSSEQQTEMLNTILHNDAELLGKVEDLRQLDAQVSCQYNTLQQKIAQLCDRAKAVEPDELKLDEPVHELIDQGLAFVLAVRKLDTGVNTWYGEATKHDAATPCPHGINPDGTCKDIVQEASEESFPASDPPSRTPITST